MDIPYLISILEKKIIILSNAKAQAFSIGDLEGLNAIDKELLSVQNTLAQLHMLDEVSRAASANNITPAEVVASGVDAVTNTVQGPSASAIINGFDISAYATDALYEQKINAILSTMPPMVNVSDMDAYIASSAPGSPVTGAMVYAAAKKYSVDAKLMMAIMRNDSDFGTEGIGARTNNPGNVGNTGVSSRNYPSWADGVAAVAEWLSYHRVVTELPPIQEEVVTPPAATSTPAVVVPPPITPPAATTTPPVATTTPPVIPPVVTPPVTSTTTPESNSTTTPIINPNPIDPQATTTQPVSTSTPFIDTNQGGGTGTTTPPTETSTTTPIVTPPPTSDTSTTTPVVETPAPPVDTASSTQAIRIPVKRYRA